MDHENETPSHRSKQTLAEFAIIAKVLQAEIRERGFLQTAIEREHGWYSGLVSAWLHARIALSLESFFQILDSLGIGTHDFFRRVYPDAEATKSPPDDGANLDPATCVRGYLHRAVRDSGTTQAAVEQAIGWTPRYLSTLLAGRRSLTFLHCLAVLRVLEIPPADFFLALNCERRSRVNS